MIRRLLISALLTLPGTAFSLDLPAGASMTGETVVARTEYALPTGAFKGGEMAHKALTGALRAQAWQLSGTALTTFQLIDLLKAQLIDEGHEILFTCSQDSCGGFDFRFATRVLGEPAMHVDLGNFRFLSASKGDSHLTLLISRSPGAAYIEVVTLGPADDTAPMETVTSSKAVAVTSPQAVGSIGARMETTGHALLGDLVFQTGSSALGEAAFASLAELAGYLAANPTKRVTLVGHTDAVGSLANNVALSKKRAGSVRQRLIDRHGVDPAQVAAEGAGFLAPIASNQTDEGRAENRRVEVILSTTQ
ncbi:OmpA family protein [Aliiroseovarius subalbicans]|uniref:OmpA family protein n=1 Tax=Aliiroseovarius subalbicans TaxID=2925840 RepID=UPI001F57C699|nr:OmpA family protein [Aliiroseovarius subalbicans]MCI2399492.1 OmpA family protein [Aliiroseovarius subalbicans]